MGHKVHPTGFRLGITEDWRSMWFANSNRYGDQLYTDYKIREFIRERLAHASISKIRIERPAKNALITIHTARPGIVIGKKGEDIDRLRRQLTQRMGIPVHVNIEEIRKPELDAQLVADNVAQQLERRIMFRRAMKRAVGNAMRLGAKGIKVQVGGRLNGSEIARSEVRRGGKIWIRIFPDAPITSKPLEVRQGKGKGNVDHWAAKVQPGRVIYEIEGVSEEVAREAFRRAAAKLPVHTRFVERTVM